MNPSPNCRVGAHKPPAQLARCVAAGRRRRCRRAIRNLDETGLQIVLAVVSRGRAARHPHGRRHPARPAARPRHRQPIESIIHRDPLVVPPQLSRDTVLQLMRVNKIHQLPVVDAERRVVGLHLWDELMDPSRRPNLMVIMAGGRGTRLRPQTENCPKPLLSVGGKPMLEHIIERARAEGFEHFVLAVHYLGHMIEEYFGDGSRWQVADRLPAREIAARNRGRIGAAESAARAALSGLQRGCADRHPLWRAARLSLPAPCRGHHGSAPARMAAPVRRGAHERRRHHRVRGEADHAAATSMPASTCSSRDALERARGRASRATCRRLFGRLQERAARTIVYPDARAVAGCRTRRRSGAGARETRST